MQGCCLVGALSRISVLPSDPLGHLGLLPASLWAWVRERACSRSQSSWGREGTHSCPLTVCGRVVSHCCQPPIPVGLPPHRLLTCCHLTAPKGWGAAPKEARCQGCCEVFQRQPGNWDRGRGCSNIKSFQYLFWIVCCAAPTFFLLLKKCYYYYYC